MHWLARCNWSRSVLVYVCVEAGDMRAQAIASLAGQSVRYRTLEAASGKAPAGDGWGLSQSLGPDRRLRAGSRPPRAVERDTTQAFTDQQTPLSDLCVLPNRCRYVCRAG